MQPVDRTAEVKAIAARRPPPDPIQKLLDSPATSQSATPPTKKGGKSIFSKLFGKSNAPAAEPSDPAKRGEAEIHQIEEQELRFLDDFLAAVGPLKDALIALDREVDEMESLCMSILGEVNLYDNVADQEQAVERKIGDLRARLVGAQDQVKATLGRFRPRQHPLAPSFVIYRRWASYLLFKSPAVYSRFYNTVDRLHTFLRERRRRMLKIAEPQLDEAAIQRRLEADHFDVFASAFLRSLPHAPPSSSSSATSALPNATASSAASDLPPLEVTYEPLPPGASQAEW